MLDDDDDRIIGRILSRREVLGLFGGGAGALLLPGCSSGDGDEAVSGQTGGTNTTLAPPATTAAPLPATATTVAATTATTPPTCVVQPALTEGPFFVDGKLDRSDIRIDPSDGSTAQGVLLKLTFRISRVAGGGCTALGGAMVDVWHCDAGGLYSDVSQNRTVGRKFLRGFQNTDGSGTATFTTIYPGWYMGRAVHIHFKIRTGSNQFTSQLFFDEATNDAVLGQAPYNTRGARDTRNASDMIYRQGGTGLLLATRQDGPGYAATFDLGLQL